MHSSNPNRRLRWMVVVLAIGIIVTACGGAAQSASGARIGLTPGPTGTASSATLSPTESASAEASSTPAESGPSGSQAADTGGGASHGDIPDNAVFLKYHGTNPAFTIQYVEGWQVSRQSDGVVIRDKDSSETVAIVATQADVSGYVAAQDLPALQVQPGFKLGKQDTIKVGGSNYVHLVYAVLAPPDPVTGKQVPSTVDRYYVPGPTGLAIVSLSTPNGVDNVDAFRLMIESFRWS